LFLRPRTCRSRNAEEFEHKPGARCTGKPARDLLTAGSFCRALLAVASMDRLRLACARGYCAQYDLMQREGVKAGPRYPSVCFPLDAACLFPLPDLMTYDLSMAAASDDEKARRVSHICTAEILMHCSVRCSRLPGAPFTNLSNPKHSSFDDLIWFTSRPQLASLHTCSHTLS